MSKGQKDEEANGEAPEPSQMVVLCHHEPSMNLCMQVIEEHKAAYGVVMDSTPGAGTMLKAALRSGACYFALAINDAHVDYLIKVARAEVQGGLDERYMTTGLKFKLQEQGCKLGEIYVQQPAAKRQKTLLINKHLNPNGSVVSGP